MAGRQCRGDVEGSEVRVRDGCSLALSEKLLDLLGQAPSRALKEAHWDSRLFEVGEPASVLRLIRKHRLDIPAAVLGRAEDAVHEGNERSGLGRLVVGEVDEAWRAGARVKRRCRLLLSGLDHELGDGAVGPSPRRSMVLSRRTSAKLSSRVKNS